MNKVVIILAALAGMFFSIPAGALNISVKGKEDSAVKLAEQELRDNLQGSGTVELRLVKDRKLGKEGYRISTAGGKTTIEASGSHGLLYGAYHLIRLDKSGEKLQGIIEEIPAYDLRMLNHWDNLDGTIERGYAGSSLWNWDELPDVVSPRYEDYARINASVGINATVLNNVNASSKILSREYLEKVAKLADVFRPFGIKVFLSANFAAPMQLDSLPTADPLDPAVAGWWRKKCDEIYRLIPDFGGFLVKANSEGQPGPCDFEDPMQRVPT